MTVTPSFSIGSPYTCLTDMESCAPLSSSLTFISLSFELGPSFLSEGGHSLACILGCEREIEEPPLIFEPELEQPLEGAVHRLLGETVRDRRFRCDVPPKALRLVEPRLGLDDTCGEACRERLP